MYFKVMNALNNAQGPNKICFVKVQSNQEKLNSEFRYALTGYSGAPKAGLTLGLIRIFICYREYVCIVLIEQDKSV